MVIIEKIKHGTNIVNTKETKLFLVFSVFDQP